MTFQEAERPSSSSELTVWAEVPSEVTAGDPRFAPGRRPAPWEFTPSEVHKKRKAQIGVANGLFDERF